jgi:hypothetical protein
LADNVNAVGATGSEVRGIRQYTTDFFSPCNIAATFKLQKKKTGIAKLKGSRNVCNVFKTTHYRFFPNL